MMRIHAGGRTDVGQAREVNEDAFHLGDSVFAVADGMGGHVAGEVASNTALEPIAALDGRVYSDAGEARTALREALVEANEAVVAKAVDDPQFQGMGTTLTAVLVEGRRAHIAHVGDSRGYLFRDGVFSQLTTDHTLVQRMIEEGRLTPEEAARHPQRSVITRAIGVEPDVDVDAMSLDLLPGDVIVLCSDGLSGPVGDDAIAEMLEPLAVDEDGDGDDDEAEDAHVSPDERTHHAEATAERLVEAANRAGGPDNITVVVLEFEELPTAPTPRTLNDAPLVVRSQPESEGDDWASRLGRFGDLGGRHGMPPGEPHEDRGSGGSSTGQRIAAAIIVVGLLVGAVFAGGRWVLSRSYYVGLEGERVVIYQGVPTSVGPFDLSWPLEPTTLTTDDLPARVVRSLEEGVAATSPADAETLVDNYRRMADGGDSE